MSTSMTGAHAEANAHAARFATKLPCHAGIANTYYIHDCSCGWKSPLCADADRARELYEQHRDVQGARLRVVNSTKNEGPEGPSEHDTQGDCTA